MVQIITSFLVKLNRQTLAWVTEPTINTEKPTVVDEDDLLIKADKKKAKPTCRKNLEKIEEELLLFIYNSPA